jgi:hypothetical protein
MRTRTIAKLATLEVCGALRLRTYIPEPRRRHRSRWTDKAAGHQTADHGSGAAPDQIASRSANAASVCSTGALVTKGRKRPRLIYHEQRVAFRSSLHYDARGGAKEPACNRLGWPILYEPFVALGRYQLCARLKDR